MFSKRPDGVRTKGLDYFARMLPFIMNKRYDASNLVTQYIPYETVKEYIKTKRQEDKHISFMTIILASYVRALKKHPMINRFVMNGYIYDRKGIWISFVVLRPEGETVVKIPFDGDETLFEVDERLNEYIEKARAGVEPTLADKIMENIFAVPLIPRFVVGLLKWLDRINCLPKSIIDGSPMHTSLFFTNLASIKLEPVYHHIYDFGTTTVFFALGNKFKKLELDKEKNVVEKEYFPIKIVTDERICDGVAYARAINDFKKLVMHPEVLEKKMERGKMIKIKKNIFSSSKKSDKT